MNSDSIYYFIQNVLKTVPGTPYSFQNSLINGYKDTSFLALERFGLDISRYTGVVSENIKIDYKEKNLLSKNLFDLIVLTTDDDSYKENLINHLYQEPLYSYMDLFMNRLKDHMDIGDIDENALYELGLNLAMDSFDYELVSLGILILGFYENDFSTKVIRVLGYHSIFTSYAVEAFSQFEDSNEHIFDLTKNTLAFGKIISLLNLSPLTLEQMDWLMMDGGADLYYPEICSEIVLSKPELNDFLIDYLDDEAFLKSISSLFAYGIPGDYFSTSDWTHYAFEKYCNISRKNCDFMTLSSYISIQDNLHSKLELNNDQSLVDGWTFGKRFIVSNMCKELIKNGNWENTVVSELTEANSSPKLIISALKKLDIVPKFKDFENLMDKYKYNPHIGAFLMVENPHLYLRDTLKYTKAELSNILIDFIPIDSNMGKLAFSSDEYENTWIIMLLNSMRSMNINDESFFLECLKAKNPEIRIAAAKCLENFSKGWSNDVLSVLEKTVMTDTDSRVRRELHGLLTVGKCTVKMHKALDVSDLDIKPSEADIPVIELSIVGTFYHSLSEVFDNIKKGTILYLVKIKQKDCTINIAVTTTDGYVIGYIPNEDIDMLIPLLDSGNMIYGVFNSNNIDVPRPDITIMMNQELYKSKRVTPIAFSRYQDE